MKILAVVPARGGSKGIPKKNIRLLSGKPLLFYAINNAQMCTQVTDVVVSTDNDEIAYIASRYGADVLMRTKELAEDDVVLDPVIYDALVRIEEKKGYKYDYVITMQPTSPLLKLNSLEQGILYIVEKGYDCLISVVNHPHLSWREDEKKRLVPNYEKRLNRQQLKSNYIENGAFVISRRDIVVSNSRISGKVGVYQISDEEGQDIDDINDWILCENILRRKRIIFRMDGYLSLGMGHVYNCITLACSMIEHDVLLIIRSDSVEGIKKVKESNLPYKIIINDEEINDIIEEFKPDIWVNDRLNTDYEYIEFLKSKIKRVITIEDLGDGTKCADAVINALYTDSNLNGKNVFNGWKYVCLRDEFLIETPTIFSERVENVMIMFGGTDPSNYTKTLYDIVCGLPKEYEDINFHFVTGIGYDEKKNGIIAVGDKNIYVHSNLRMVTSVMKEADIGITSQGRAIFEFAAMGVPSIVLSQNERETSHSFASMRHGFINLGIGEDVNHEVIENTLNWLINTTVIRRKMHETMLQYPLREGIERVKNIILGDDLNDLLD